MGINDWIEDIKSKTLNLSIREEENKLKMLEGKLSSLLSNDKKIELEIADIEKLLNI